MCISCVVCFSSSGNIVPSQCRYSVETLTIRISLVKTHTHKWRSLEKSAHTLPLSNVSTGSILTNQIAPFDAPTGQTKGNDDTEWNDLDAADDSIITTPTSSLPPPKASLSHRAPKNTTTPFLSSSSSPALSSSSSPSSRTNLIPSHYSNTTTERKEIKCCHGERSHDKVRELFSHMA